jgi:accessory gene regulator B
MIAAFSKKWAAEVGRQLGSTNNEVEVYTYGLEIFLCIVINILTIFFISIVLDVLIQALLITLTIAGIRVYGGGSHLATYSRCLVSGTVIVIGLALLSMVSVPAPVIHGLAILCLLMAFWVIKRWIPAGTEKKSITDPEQQLMQKRKTAATMLIWLLLLSMTIYYSAFDYEFCLILGALAGLFTITPAGYNFSKAIDKACDFNKEV